MRNWAKVNFIQFNNLGASITVIQYGDTPNDQKTPAARIVFWECWKFAGLSELLKG